MLKNNNQIQVERDWLMEGNDILIIKKPRNNHPKEANITAILPSLNMPMTNKRTKYNHKKIEFLFAIDKFIIV